MHVDVAWLFETVVVLSMLTRHSVVVNIWHAQDDDSLKIEFHVGSRVGLALFSELN